MPRKFYKENDESIPAIVFELEQPINFTEITDAVEIKKLYILKYQQRIQDGNKYILDFTADRYIDILNEVYTQQQVFDLESHIKDLVIELQSGWWLSAQDTNASLSISGIYNDDMKASIQAIIDTYVLSNY